MVDKIPAGSAALKRLCVCFGLIMGCVCCLQAQEPAYNVDAFSLREGLIQSQVRAICQDSRGYLWLGTHRGLSRFDGVSFRNYEANDKLKGSLQGNFVSAILEDRQGRVWVATDQGVSLFQGYYFLNYTASDSLQSVRCIMEDRQGRIWFGADERGLSIYENGSFNHRPYRWQQGERQRNVQALLEDSRGRVWIGLREGLFRLSDDGEIRREEHPALPPNLQVYCLLEDRDGRIWVGTQIGAFCLEGEAWLFFNGSRGLPAAQVLSLAEDRDGQIWAGTPGGAAWMAGNRFVPLRDAAGHVLELNIQSILSDNEGNIWLGTDGSGALKVSRAVFAVYTLEQGMSSNLAKSFLEDDEGRIWISTYDKGINVWENGSIVRRYTRNDGLAGNDIGFSFRDSRGDFWFSSYTQGLSRYRKGRFESFNTAQGLVSNIVYCIAEDQQGHIWVGTKEGISIWDGQHFSQRYTRAQGLLDNTVYCIHAATNGDMWIGSLSGLSVLRRNSFMNYDKLGRNLISIQEDSRGRKWLATSSGLMLYEQGRFDTIRVDVSPSANNIVALVLEDNFLWVGTEAGVYRLDLIRFSESGETAFEHFTRSDGLPSLETNANAAFRDSRSGIWLGTSEGAVRCPARPLRSSRQTPLTSIVEVRSSAQDSSLRYSTTNGLPEKLRIPFTRNRISFRYIGISLTNPADVRYQYRLSGYDTTWSELTTSTDAAAFTNLPPGPYTFSVRAYIKSEPDVYGEAHYDFRIIPAFWQTWLFRVAMLLLLLLLAYGIYRYVDLRNRRRREAELLKYKAELLALEHQALYAMMNPHFTFNALQSIQYYIHKQDKIAATKFLSQFAKLVRMNLESTKSETISLAEELNRLELYMSLEKMRFMDKFDYEIRVSPEVDIHDTMIPPMILQPFVENSIKHGIMPLESGGRIEVDVQPRDEDHLLITLTDNGIGIEASKARKANRPSEHVSKGMQITRDRLALFGKMTGKEHDVSLVGLSHPDGSPAGTQVKVLLPREG